MAQPAPLPVKHGVNPTRLRLPEGPASVTVAEYMIDRFSHLNPSAVTERFEIGEVVAADGEPLTLDTRLGAHEFIWYYRTPPAHEPHIPGELTILHQDRDLIVVDKPHFLPTTPGGRFVQQSALVKLRNMTGNPDLIPLHRLDRATAGVLLFSANPDTRGPYQMMFENRQVTKVYEAVSALPDGSAVARDRFPLVFRNRIVKTKGVITAEVEPYGPEVSGRLEKPRTGKRRRLTTPTTGPNAETRISVLDVFEESGRIHFHLEPHTGRTHQLRIHLAALGVPILHDPFYPELQDHGPDDYDRPLQLLARGLSFPDPLTGEPRQFRSARHLAFATDTGSNS